ncbi:MULTISPECIES: CPBP family intramembrane glutamic endopeptidase [Pseudonocardia]|uniref:Abortive infection protein n=1 Tax=Pseudonocardia saturnea TaxID=33909 RepID=A0ABQ0S3I9_9PSEU|nr:MULTISPECIES: type II CAAX endopeptidase family protein [Pseudonocardia]TDN74582.1 CAAX prenyl protease-like protein [Pseudonocardia autotrophica]BBG05351.1 abortive infection protein [Pseudonocardia autotrophica]GEC27475.1 abortive infection protein [Pseudonocardia saturnea]
MSTVPAAGPVTRPAAGRIERRDLRSIAVFLVLAFGLAWLVALPLWLGDGLADPVFTPTAMLMMVTPAIAAVVVVFLVERPAHRARALGLWPLRPVGRLFGWIAAGIAVCMAVVLVSLPVGALIGVYPADFTGLSGFRQTLADQVGSGQVPGSLGVLAAVQIALIPLAAFVGVLPALGEEIGWRGWLLPKLMPLGPVPAILVSGVIWGTWHAPVLLLGYNYPDAPGWLAIAAMSAMCVLVGAILGWLRLRSGSVWPAALGHSAFNATAGSFLLFSQAGATIDTTQATILGWSGWIVPLVLVVVLVATGRFAPARTA